MELDQDGPAAGVNLHINPPSSGAKKVLKLSGPAGITITPAEVTVMPGDVAISVPITVKASATATSGVVQVSGNDLAGLPTQRRLNVHVRRAIQVILDAAVLQTGDKSPIWFSPCSRVTYAINVDVGPNVSGPIMLTAENLPSGVTATFNPTVQQAPAHGGRIRATVTFTTALDTGPGKLVPFPDAPFKLVARQMVRVHKVGETAIPGKYATARIDHLSQTASSHDELKSGLVLIMYGQGFCPDSTVRFGVEDVTTSSDTSPKYFSAESAVPQKPINPDGTSLVVKVPADAPGGRVRVVYRSDNPFTGAMSEATHAGADEFTVTNQPWYRLATSGNGNGDVDESIAVGDDYVVIGWQRTYRVYDKRHGMELVKNGSKDNFKFNNVFSALYNTLETPPDTCVYGAYDSRVSYARGRFWLLSHVAPFPAGGGGACDLGTPLNRHYTFIAVSKEGKAPTGGASDWWIYNVQHIKADWPLMAVHGDRVFVHHRHNSADRFRIFDANALMNGVWDKKEPPHLWVWASTDFPATHIRVPKHYSSPAPGVTLVLSASDKTLNISGIPATLGAGHPLLKAASYDDPDDSFSLSESVYRDGMLYVVGHPTGSEGMGKATADKPATMTNRILLWRIPVSISGDSVVIQGQVKKWIVYHPDAGFRDTPTVDVNKNNDVVIGYRAYGPSIPNESRATVLYHDESDRRSPVALRTPSGIGPGYQRVDFHSSALDPDGVTIWTVVDDKDGMVIGRVRP